MKKKFILAAMAAVVLASCSEKAEIQPENTGEKVEMQIMISCGQTRAGEADVPLDEKVNNVQVFVFGSEGRLEAYETKSDVTTLTMGVFSGEKRVVAVVNAPELTGVMDFDTFCTMTSDLQDNSLENFVMVGEAFPNVGIGNTTVNINVTRLVSKVTLTKVTNSLAGVYGELPFKVVRAFLVNVVGDITYYSDEDSAYEPKLWYNERDFVETSEIAELSCHDYADFDTEAESKHFYCYPNPTATDSSAKGEWVDRFTRLVVQIELDEKEYYYPVNLRGMESNNVYQVELDVTRPGSLDPDLPYDPNSATVNVSVNPWGEIKIVEDQI